jgi:hypothetical protein
MASPIREIDHEARTVREVQVFVRQYVWPDGPSSYDVHLVGRQTRGRDGEMTDCLTPDDSFDHMPSDEDIERLPYIDPSIRREAPGVFYILTGPYQKGPYPSRREANADIRAGNW